MIIKTNYVDINNRTIFAAKIELKDKKIAQITPINESVEGYAIPGFVDAHVHIESSMLIPSEFARLAVIHGSVGTVSDPHEIANVMGLEGVYYMIENGKKVPFKFNFGAPSCVPATSFETAGAEIDVEGIKTLMADNDIKYMAEMMNYPGVIFEDPMVMAKLAAAKAANKPIDGHAPGVRGEQIQKYIQAGISTDHECFELEEALEKLSLGMKVIIREGSAAKNFDTLISILPEHTANVMFCSDDKHPDDLMLGHINQLAARAVAQGIPLFDVLQVACINPVQHYNLDIGLLQVGDWADFAIVKDLQNFEVEATYINGQLVAQDGKSLIHRVDEVAINNFNTYPKEAKEFVCVPQTETLHVIKAIDGALITESFEAPAKIEQGNTISNTETDVLKMVVVNRYSNTPPAVAFINGFNLKEGALASCVGHDSHNIIAVGTDDDAICKAVNLIIKNKGGISAIGSQQEHVLPLPVAGIMSTDEGELVANLYSTIDRFSKEQLGCSLRAPFMTLSFMALLVIPRLKLSDKGLFDGGDFKFTPLFV
ncbi:MULTISPECIES: adenine deaminase [unclassified Aureispira]|uniref:adenine deaminase n=1 Tax=unclassified Aureispira TaxID=2649989 RepID=UPI000697AE4E|nr:MULTISPECIES: adenine deaminase [unclassified Aureispira]WMX13961.1 adenine deaminase [Aureispira sp. CCB-E]